MDKTLKQRLIGAAVIIALAVIFIPMLLEGPSSDDPVTMKIEIPEKPVYEIPGRLEAPPTPETVIIPPAMTTTAEEEAKTEMVIPDSESVQTTEPETKTTAVEPAVVVPEPVVVTPPVAKKTEPVKQPEPVKKPAILTDTGFVVQVGSFSQRQNAIVLSDKLEASGYPAFVESGKSSNKSIYRVKVGPRPTREEADKLRQTLADKENLKGIIVSHP